VFYSEEDIQDNIRSSELLLYKIPQGVTYGTRNGGKVPQGF